MKIKTLSAKKIKSNYHLIDGAQIKSFGRELTTIASILKGKYRINMSKNLAVFDKIIIINGNKIPTPNNPEYKYHTGYAGGLKTRTYKYLQSTNIADFIKKSLKNMLGRGAQVHNQLKNVKVFSDIPSNLANITTSSKEDQEKLMIKAWGKQ